MDKRRFNKVAWRDRSASVARTGAPIVETASRPAGGGYRPWNDQVEDGIADDEVPPLFVDQYESVWEVMLARMRKGGGGQ